MQFRDPKQIILYFKQLKNVKSKKRAFMRLCGTVMICIFIYDRIQLHYLY
jgi:hypothetical protein